MRNLILKSPRKEKYPDVTIILILQYSDALMDAAQNAKGAAVDAAAAGVESFKNYNEQDYEKAVDLLTESLRNQFSNLTLCRRAEYLLRMNPPRPNACVNDCTAVLSRNADSAKALKIRGKAYAYVYNSSTSFPITSRMLNKWMEAAQDLRRACGIDYDEETDALRKEVDLKAHAIEEEQRKLEQQKREEEERAKEERQRAYRERVMREKEERKRQEEEEERAKQNMGGMPGGMPGGMGGMPGGMPGGMGGMPGGMPGGIPGM